MTYPEPQELNHPEPQELNHPRPQELTADELVAGDLIEEVSIDGMCGVY